MNSKRMVFVLQYEHFRKQMVSNWKSPINICFLQKKFSKLCAQECFFSNHKLLEANCRSTVVEPEHAWADWKLSGLLVASCAQTHEHTMHGQSIYFNVEHIIYTHALEVWTVYVGYSDSIDDAELLSGIMHRTMDWILVHDESTIHYVSRK